MEEAREITFDIFEILLNFCVFLIFLEISKISKPVIGRDTALLKLKICHLQSNSEPNTVNNWRMWPAFQSKWRHIDGGSSGDHFWHFWNFAEFLYFSDFFGNFQNFQKLSVFWRLKSTWCARCPGKIRIKVMGATQCYYARKNGPPMPWNIFEAQLLNPKTLEVTVSKI